MVLQCWQNNATSSLSIHCCVGPECWENIKMPFDAISFHDIRDDNFANVFHFFRRNFNILPISLVLQNAIVPWNTILLATTTTTKIACIIFSIFFAYFNFLKSAECRISFIWPCWENNLNCSSLTFDTIRFLINLLATFIRHFRSLTDPFLNTTNIHFHLFVINLLHFIWPLSYCWCSNKTNIESNEHDTVAFHFFYVFLKVLLVLVLHLNTEIYHFSTVTGINDNPFVIKLNAHRSHSNCTGSIAQVAVFVTITITIVIVSHRKLLFLRIKYKRMRYD